MSSSSVFEKGTHAAQGIDKSGFYATLPRSSFWTEWLFLLASGCASVKQPLVLTSQKAHFHPETAHIQ
jgi:hypothetical protein